MHDSQGTEEDRHSHTSAASGLPADILSFEELDILLDAVQSSQDALAQLDANAHLFQELELEVVHAAPVPSLQQLKDASCYAPPDPDPACQKQNELAEAQVLHAMASRRYSDAVYALHPAAIKVCKNTVRHYRQRKLALGDNSVDDIPPRGRLPHPSLHLVSLQLFPEIRPSTPLDASSSRSDALYWVCFLTLKVLRLLELEPANRPQDQWAETMESLQQAWQTAQSAASFTDQEVEGSGSALRSLADHYYLWLAYGVRQSNPGAEVFIAECNVFYLWLILQGTSLEPLQPPEQPAILDAQVPALMSVAADDDIDMLSAGGGDWDPAPDNYSDQSGADQRQRRTDDFLEKKPLLLQRLLMLRGSTMDDSQPCNGCGGGKVSVLFCIECNCNLCTTCDHSRHRLQGLHRRRALHSGAKLAALETVVIEPETDVCLGLVVLTFSFSLVRLYHPLPPTLYRSGG